MSVEREREKPQARVATKPAAFADLKDGLQSLENFLEKNRKIVLAVMMVFTALFSYLMFNARLSFASDDSTYIKSAYDFNAHGRLSTFQGVLYPLFLSFIIKIFGYKL